MKTFLIWLFIATIQCLMINFHGVMANRDHEPTPHMGGGGGGGGRRGGRTRKRNNQNVTEDDCDNSQVRICHKVLSSDMS